MSEFIPVNTPILKGNEKKYVMECLESGWLSSEGPFVSKFEKNFSKVVNRQYAIAVSSGTTALEIAVKSLKIGEGDEIIMPTFTIISCALAIVRAGATPVLVDSDIETWNMDVKLIEEKITSKTKAIMVVHTYGLSVDMDAILEIASKYQLKIIEDAAEAQGLEYNGKPCGSFGDISIFSFYANKLITTGEGGMVVTNNQELATRAKSLRNLCFQSQRRFFHEELGLNARMTNLQAAIGVAQLENLQNAIKIKRNIGELYQKGLSKISKLQKPLDETVYSKNIYWVFGVVAKKTYLFRLRN